MTPFANLIGHVGQIELLRNEAASPAGAYLLVGAAGIGKSAVGLSFAAAVLCPSRGVHDEDDGCRSCRLAFDRHHPDLIVVEPHGRQSLGVDQARETIAASVLSPIEAHHKVFLFEEAESMTEQAANALLKTLEEPSRAAVFLLVAGAESDLPDTVVSRCRTIHFGRVSEGEVVAGLIERGLDEGRAGQLARIAGGRPGLALTLHDSPAVASFREAWLSVPERAVSRAGESFLLAREMLDSLEPLLEGVGGDASKEQVERDRRRASSELLVSGLEILASWYLDSAAIGHGGILHNPEVPASSLTMLSARRGVMSAERVLDAIVDLKANLRPQLLLADLFCDLALD